jgi:hypothetical protein
MSDKPLGRKAYGSIAHLPGSRLGPGDHHAHQGQVLIATKRKRDRHDSIVVQEKLDGSCTAVAKVEGEIIPLGRAGYRAIASPYEQHHLFHDWAIARWEQFDSLLNEGERVIGEWLAQAHGTKYDLAGRLPWVVFDIIGTQDEKRVPRATTLEVNFRVATVGLVSAPHMPMTGDPVSIEDAMTWLGAHGFYGAHQPEGAVWRVEREGRVDFVVKYVRPDKVDGIFLPDTAVSVTGGETVWNWRPAA